MLGYVDSLKKIVEISAYGRSEYSFFNSYVINCLLYCNLCLKCAISTETFHDVYFVAKTMVGL
jgi:hypothetical protein